MVKKSRTEEFFQKEEDNDPNLFEGCAAERRKYKWMGHDFNFSRHFKAVEKNFMGILILRAAPEDKTHIVLIKRGNEEQI